MRGARPVGRGGTGCLTPHPSGGQGAGGGKLFQICGDVIDAHLIKGLVDQVLVPRVQNFLHGAGDTWLVVVVPTPARDTVSYACGGRGDPSSAMLALHSRVVVQVFNL